MIAPSFGLTITEDQISQEVRGNAPLEYAQWLRQDENLDEWHLALVNLKRRIEMQMAERTASLAELRQSCLRRGPDGKAQYFESEAEHIRWKASANRFKTSVEMRLQENKILRRKLHDREQQEYQSAHMFNGHTPQILDQLARLSTMLTDMNARLHAVEEWLSEETPE